MKNFTKQNFKTNPLWIRLLIMTFMLLAGAGNVWAGMWVNDSNGWNIQIEKNGSTDWLSSGGFNREDKNGSYKDYTSTELKSFSIKKAWIKASSNDNWQIRYAAIYCRVSKNQTGNFTQKKCKDYGSNVSNANSAYFELDVNYDILNGLEPGTYYLDYYFGIGNDGCDKPYCYAPEYNCSGTKPYCSNCQNCNYYSIKFKVPEQEKKYSLGGYLNGADKGYNTDFELIKQNDGTYKGTFNNFNTSTHYFQVFDESGTKWGVKSYTSLTVGNSVTLSKTDNGEKVGVSLTKGTSYVFTFNPSNGSFSIKLACASANFSVSLSSSSVTVGQANIKASITGTHSPAVTWSSSDGDIAEIDANGNITAKKYGKVTITATTKGTDSYCSGTQQTAELTVKETPTISISGATTFCGTSTTLTAEISGLTTANTAGKTIKWYKDGVDTGNTGDTYNATATGTYTAKITGTYIKETTSAGFSVTKKATPTASNFTYTEPTSLTYDGYEKSAKVVWNGTQGGTITVKYSSTSNKYTVATPKNAGTYYVFVSTVENDNYCAVTDLYINTFTIDQADQTDFKINNTETTICGTSVIVTTQGGKSTTTKYSIDSSNTTAEGASVDETSGDLTVTGPGKVTVKATNSATTNYKEKTIGKEFTFKIPATLSWNAMPDKGFLVAGETIEATLAPAEAGSITYNTTDITVIGISNGKLTAQPYKNGTANIIATPSLGVGYCGATAIEYNVPVKFFNVAGTENLCGNGDGVDDGPVGNKEAWNTTSHPMSYDEANKVWYRTFEAKPADEYQFQITQEVWDRDNKDVFVFKNYPQEPNANLECEEININSSQYINIGFTTPTKGKVTIYYNEKSSEGYPRGYAYARFEPICLETIDVKDITADKDKGQYNYNETAKLSIADATIDAAYGTVYSISYQWQEKNGDDYTNIQGATGKTYNATNLEVGSHTYRVAVSYLYTGFDKTCSDTKYSAPKTITVICPAPTTPLEISSTDVVRCGGKTKTYGTITIGNYKVYGENSNFYLGSTKYTYSQIDQNKGLLAGIEFTDKNAEIYHVYVETICGNSVSEKLSSKEITLIATDITPAAPDFGENTGIEVCANTQVTLPTIAGKTLKWYDAATAGNEVASTTFNATATKTYYAATVGDCESTNRTAYTVTVNPLPEIAIDLTSFGICMGDGEEVETDLTFLAIAKASEGSTPVWYDADETIVTNADLTKANTTYYVAAKDNKTGCESERLPFIVTVNKRPEEPTLSASEYKVCEDESNTINLNELAGARDVVWYLGETEVEKPNQVFITEAGTFTYKAIAVNNFGCVSATGAEFVLTIDAQPTFTAPTATQTNKEITLTSDAGASTQWSVSPTENVTLTNNGDGTATFVATANGDYTITASNGVCTQVSHTIKVSDAFYIWVRNAKESDYAYGQFYFPNENSEAVRGGAMFYAECDARPTQDNYKSYNEGGRPADIVQSDCDGYTWYGFKASEEVISGTKYFYVHATNDISNGGYYTHSVPLKVTISADLYYTLGENGNSYWGWNLATASAPYAGPMVLASGSTTLGSNIFAALYVTDCSAKTVKSYQWESSSAQNGTYTAYKANVSNSGTLYSGDAGTTNNIRPSEAGWYRCKVTYDDASNATSEAIQVTGTYSHEGGSLPVFVVNTNGEGFPVNDCSGTPSKNADNMKAKVSVDVKIYKAGTMVYDRKARMNYRGSSSLNFLKKSYAFCPGKANCVEDKGRQDYVKTEKMNMLNVGSAEDKDWVLYAAAPDPSLMRNRLVFDTFRDMTGKWSVNSCYVQLYVDGTYKGIYVLMDKITKNENRVDITDENGFIVKFDKTDKEDRVGGYNGKLGDEKTFKTTRTGADNLGSYDTSIDQRFEIEYPEKDDYPTGWAAKVNSIKAMFEGFENALAAKDFATVQKYIDYDSWADWFIISEYAKNVDAYRASCIFVYNGNKIEATPLWDQELSFNNQTMVNHGNNDATGLLVTRSSIYGDSESFKAPFWFTNKGTDIDNITGGLLSDPCFVQVVKEKWNQYSTGTGALTADALNKKIDAYKTELGSATDIDFNMNTMDCGSCDNGGCYLDNNGNKGNTGYTDKDKSSSITAIDTWIKNRGNGLTNAINKLTGASFSIQIIPSEVQTTPWEQAHIAVNVTPEGYDYVLEYTDNNLGGVPNVIIEENGNEMTYRIPRPWSAGNEQVEGERADIEYGIKATLNVASGTIVCGSQAAPTSTAKIILQDEPNEDCNK